MLVTTIGGGSTTEAIARSVSIRAMSVASRRRSLALVRRTVGLTEEATRVCAASARSLLRSRLHQRYATLTGTVDGDLALAVVRDDGSFSAPVSLLHRAAFVRSTGESLGEGPVGARHDPLAVTLIAARAFDTVFSVDLLRAGTRSREAVTATACASDLGSRRSPWDAFRIERSEEDGIPVLYLIGELDISFAEEVQGALLRMNAPRVVVDLSKLSFIDARGLSALAAAHRILLAGHSQLEVRGASGLVRRVFDIAHLEDLLID